MKRYKTKVFAKWARKERLRDNDLCEAAREIERGQIDATLGKVLVKKRIAREGGGKSGGYRTVVMFRAGSRMVFLYGFPKSAKGNLSVTELEAYQALAKIFDKLPEGDLAALCERGELKELICDE
ncbi:type II toxin-antitoxin system RelE/ParE family toxin [Parvibaculum sp.]|jgi:hypothetical protein|uniref:type II toxin-antitoxin system RelE/ParE family toxin n=1 Tax=Parvibaculum sp. TaxID=2024848 RepID=UPI002FDAEC29